MSAPNLTADEIPLTDRHGKKIRRRWKADPQFFSRSRVPTEEQRRSLLTRRLANKVHKTEHCWYWTGAVAGNGYGNFSLRAFGGKFIQAPRLSFFLRHGYLPPVVMHRCDNSLCVRPDHLMPGTHLSNQHEAIAKGRAAHGDRSPRAKLCYADAEKIRELIASGLTHREVAKIYGVSRPAISLIHEGRTWR